MKSPGHCETRTRNRLIVLEEKRSKMTFRNSTRAVVRKVQIVGCAITKGPRCDWLLINRDAIEHYVELKGSNVRYAFKQIETTIRKVSSNPKKANIRFWLMRNN